MPTTKSIFASKKYILFVVYIGIVIDMLAYSIVLPFLPFVVEELGEEPTVVAIILACFSLGLLFGTWIIYF